jgi:FkbM family methyltransferase
MGKTMGTIKAKARQLVRSLGFDVVRYAPEAPISAEIQNLEFQCRRLGIRGCFDVGANCGQFAFELRRAGFAGQIHSFEPVSKVHDRLRLASADDPNWIVGDRTAVGANCGSATINVALNTQSSSLLPILGHAVATDSTTAHVAAEQVPIITLESYARKAGIAGPSLLKIDVQGFESEVLKGASPCRETIAIIYLEMALVPVYQGAATVTELFSMLGELGYRCIGLYNGWTDGRTREVLEVNGVFVRNDL